MSKLESIRRTSNPVLGSCPFVITPRLRESVGDETADIETLIRGFAQDAIAELASRYQIDSGFWERTAIFFRVEFAQIWNGSTAEILRQLFRSTMEEVLVRLDVENALRSSGLFKLSIAKRRLTPALTKKNDAAIFDRIFDVVDWDTIRDVRADQNRDEDLREARNEFKSLVLPSRWQESAAERDKFRLDVAKLIQSKAASSKAVEEQTRQGVRAGRPSLSDHIKSLNPDVAVRRMAAMEMVCDGLKTEFELRREALEAALVSALHGLGGYTLGTLSDTIEDRIFSQLDQACASMQARIRCPSCGESSRLATLTTERGRYLRFNHTRDKSRSAHSAGTKIPHNLSLIRQ